MVVAAAAVIVATTQIPAETEAAIFTRIPEVGQRTASAAWTPTPLCVAVPTRVATAVTVKNRRRSAVAMAAAATEVAVIAAVAASTEASG